MKRMTKSIFALVVVIAMCVSFCVPTFAEVTNGGVHAHADACPGSTVTHTLENCSDYKTISTTAAACGQQGYTTYQCNECGKYFLDSFVDKPNDHDWVVDEDTKVEGDCTTPGYEKKTCSICGEVDETTTSAPGHDMGEWVITGFACGTEGASRRRDCKNCDYYESEALDQADHTWVIFKVTEEPVCGEPGTAIFVCSVCSAEKEVDVLPDADAHDWKVVETIREATCSEPGLGKAECSNCGKVDDNYQIPAKDDGHNWVDVPYVAPTCTTDGQTAGEKCDKCDTPRPGKESSVIAATGHSNNQVGYTAPDCDTAGKNVYQCSVCGETSEVEIPATGHSFGDKPTSKIEPTCTGYGYEFYGCTICGFVDESGLVKLDPLGHNYVKGDTSIEPDCTTTGTYVWVCDECGDTYTDPNPIPAKGHSYAPVVTEPTCAAGGYTVDVCSVCGDTTAKYAETEPDPTKHNIQSEITTPATCYTDGRWLDWCPDCSEYKEDRIIPAFNHTYNSDIHKDPANGDPLSGSAWENVGSPSDATCGNPSEQNQKCALCAHTQTIVVGEANGHNFNVADGATKVVTPATCTEGGYTTYTCANCTETWKNPAENTNALGHDYIVDETTYPTTCQGMGKVVTTCSRCDYYNEAPNGVEYDRLNPAHHPNGQKVGEYRKGTCTIIGLDDYECPDCDTVYHVAQDNDTGKGCEYFKDPDSIVTALEPTCTEKGRAAGYTCTSCGTTYGGNEIAPLGHDNSVILSAVAPTCTETGLTAGVQCARCDAITTAQQVAPALGHLNDIVLEEVEPTCTETGLTEGVRCSRCNVDTTAQQGVPALGHDDQIYAERDVNCTEFGYIYYVCDRCGDEHEYVSDYVAAHDHDYVESTRVEATCVDNGYIIYVCSHDANHTYTTVIECVGKHVNVDGLEINTSCTNENVKNRVCYTCGETVTITSHDNIVIIEADADCVNYSYKAEICTACGYEKLLEEGTKLGDHRWGEWNQTVAPTILVEGTEVRECSACHATESQSVDTINGIMFKYEIATAAKNNGIYSVKGGNNFVNSGLIAVTVSTYAETIDISNILLKLSYNANVLTFLKGEYIGDARFNAVVTSPENANGTIVVEANTYDAATNAMTDVNLDGEADFAVLYFAVKTNVTAGTAIELGVVTDETVDGYSYAGNSAAQSVYAEFGGEKTNGVVIKVTTSAKIADVSGNGVVDASDVTALAAAAQSGEYKAEADINKDGYVNALDYALLRQYLVGDITYDDMCK